mmetsp:Transcript_9714/g.34495  ORF Transcript_9714/g.34495 Transcript_9714/m.34495 type:complete len:426 (+) Transcript_9714:79-1356(+)
MAVSTDVSRLSSRLCKALSVAALYGLAAALLRGTQAFLGRWSHPTPVGQHSVGSLRGRLPLPSGARSEGLLAQVHYPADPSVLIASAQTFEYCRPEVMKAVAEGYYVPEQLLKWVMAARPQVDPPWMPSVPSVGKWPVVIFQSGLWGSFEFYTQFCRDVASMGTIVVMLEHEDGTSITAVDQSSGEVIEYEEQPKWPYDIITFNRGFLGKRTDELCEAVKAIQAIASSMGHEDLDANAAASPLLQVLRGASPERFALVGHSFGACSIVHALNEVPPELAQCCGAVLLDMWPGPLTTDPSGAFCEGLGERFPVPYVSLLSEVWADNEWYGASCRRFSSARSTLCLAAATVPGSAHYWISDISLWAPGWLLRLLGVMGPADACATYASTARAVQLSLLSIFENSSHSTLRSDFSSLGLDPIARDSTT